MLKSLLSIAALTAAATVAAPAVASASPAQVTANVNLRAGPGTQYYPVVVLPAGAPVELYGCLQSYTWCDVAYGRDRGWVSSRYLSTFYSGPVYRPRPYRSVPFLTFNFGYWDNHYTDRPWYHRRPRPDWDGNPDWDRPRSDWDRDRQYWDRNRQYGDRDRQYWDRDRQYGDRDRQYWDQDRQRTDWNRDRNDGRNRDQRRDVKPVGPGCQPDDPTCVSITGNH